MHVNKPAAKNHGQCSSKCGLLQVIRIVASCFGTLGFPGTILRSRFQNQSRQHPPKDLCFRGLPRLTKAVQTMLSRRRGSGERCLKQTTTTEPNTAYAQKTEAKHNGRLTEPRESCKNTSEHCKCRAQDLRSKQLRGISAMAKAPHTNPDQGPKKATGVTPVSAPPTSYGAFDHGSWKESHIQMPTWTSEVTKSWLLAQKTTGIWPILLCTLEVQDSKVCKLVVQNL